VLPFFGDFKKYPKGFNIANGGFFRPIPFYGYPGCLANLKVKMGRVFFALENFFKNGDN
jgi:hypothetical protein